MSALDVSLQRLSSRQRRELLARLLLHQAGIEEELPCSWHQEQAWFFQQREPDSSRANLGAAIQLPTAALAGLPAALTEVVARHEALRTGFVAQRGRAALFIDPEAWLHPTYLDLKPAPAGRRAAEIERLTLADLLAPFDLSRPPLFRLQALLLDGANHLLFASAHESVADGWSLWVLLSEIVERAVAQIEGRRPAVPESQLSYRERIREERASDFSRLDLWRSRLAGLPPPPPLPMTPRVQPVRRSVRGAVHTFTVPPETVTRLRLLVGADQGGSALLLPLLAAYAVWLAGLSGAGDLAVGIPSPNRTQPEELGIVGPLAGYLPIRFTLSHDPSFADLLGTTSLVVNEAFQGPAPTVAELVAQLWPERLIEREPLFRGSFFLQELSANWAGVPPDPHAHAAWQPAALAAPHDLALVFVVGGDQVVGRVEYAADLWSPQTVAGWFAGFLDLLAAASAAPERPVSSFLPTPPIAEAAVPAPRSAPPEPASPPVATPAPVPPPAAPVAPAASATPPTVASIGEGATSDADHQAIEQVLAAIWQEVLHVDQVEPTDSFFRLGGHSLLAMQVHSFLIEVLGFEAPMRLQFDAPNLRTLARNILAALPDPPAGAAAARVWLGGRAAGGANGGRPGVLKRGASAVVPREASAAVAPASFNQQRLWFLDQLEPGSSFYNLHVVLRLSGHLNQGALHRALAEIVRRHETLRTTFATSESDDLVQVVHPPGELPLPVDDLRATPPSERTAALERLVLADVHTPFDLARGPLFRVRLVQRADGEHLLVLVMHHIVLDAWSLGILTHEVQTLYQAFASGRPSPLPPLERQYSDFARWQREMLQGKRLERLLTYWKSQLAGAPPVLELPADRPRPQLQSFSGAMLAFELDPEVATAAAELGGREQGTPFMVMLAAFAALLARYARQEDIVVGSPIANRHLPELAPLIGFFNNTLVLRVDLSGDPSFTELVRRVRNMTIDAYDHQELPFERLVDELQPERNLSHNPLFQVLFSFDSDLGPRLARSDNDDLPEVHSGTSKFDLGLYTFHTAQGLGGAFEYNTDLFDRRRIERLAEHLKALLRGAVRASEVPLSQIDILTPAERAELLAWSRLASAIPAEGCAHELFARQAELFPEELAACCGAATLTFGELDRAANRLAHLLRREGVGPDVRVGLSVERSLDLLVAFLGVLKAGGAYVPIDPSYPKERIVYMLEDAAIATLLTESAVAGRLPSVPGVTRLCLDELGPRLAAEPTTAPATGITLDHLVYTIYTSGSTGRPKGVAMPHRAVADLVTWQSGQPYFGSGGRTLQFTSLSFDVSFQEIFATWLAGGCMVMISEEDRRDPERLARILAEERVERIFQPFVAMQQLCEVLAEAPRMPAELRLIVTAGEQLQITPQIARTFARLPRCRLFNQYGPSETHIVTEEPVPRAAQGEPVLPPIGRPVAGATTYELDAHLCLQPAGVPGELYIGGSAVARGYLNRPELTAERFLPDPFCGRPGARMYRTGDIARTLPWGSIQFEGRVDDQVKIRGFRVEPGEVESVLRRHPAVREALVVVRPDPGGEKRLVAYCITEDGQELPLQELRERMEAGLPEYMFPTLLLKIDELPLTPSGKIDRRALPQPDFGARRVTDAYVAPDTPIEQSLAAIFKAILGIEQVGVNDSFFDLGGQSLLATRVVARVREQLGVNLTVRLIFEAPTVAELALAVSNLDLERRDADAGDVGEPVWAQSHPGSRDGSAASRKEDVDGGR